ncbi:50S ribosomal protein L25/general stress protein Ctc [Alphaproteobacteria bacterium]|nr:50S ribosomal protein L25/general stress protein Ctc [Alphaproteobacteria bacterium]
MTDIRSLSLQEREQLGTGATRALRRTGYVPVSLYGKNQPPKNLSVEERVLVKEMKEKGVLSHLFEVSVDNKPQKVLIRAIQRHPVSDRPLHLDLLAIDSNSRIKVDITIRILNEEKSPGLKQGGVLNLLRHELPAICSPDSIPEFIDIDLGKLKMGDSIHLRDLALPQGVEIEHPEKIETILTIAQPKIASANEDTDSEEPSEEAESDTAKSEEK